MKVFAVDPGYDRVGIAVIERDTHQKETLIYSTCITTNKKDSFYERLHTVQQQLDTLLNTYVPDFFVFEELYFAKNTKTALRVAEARGIISGIALQKKLPVYEIHPNHVKIAITGSGSAKKEDILWMIPKLISINTTGMLDDEIDAVAIGLAFFARYRILVNQ